MTVDSGTPYATSIEAVGLVRDSVALARPTVDEHSSVPGPGRGGHWVSRTAEQTPPRYRFDWRALAVRANCQVGPRGRKLYSAVAC
jgi:hypothetical protein